MGKIRSVRWDRLSRWVALVLGMACIIVGAALITRLFQSLTVLIILVAAGSILTGLSDLVDKANAPASKTATYTGLAWVVLGIAILIWPGLSLEAVTLIVGIALIGGGMARILPALRADRDQRTVAILLGAASVILGLVTLAWPDITLLLVAVLFGVRVVMFGLARLGDGFRQPRPDAGSETSPPPGQLRRHAQTLGAALALLVSLTLAMISLRWHQGSPTVDAFYETPVQLPSQPGRLVRIEPLNRAIPAGAQAWRILYTTTRSEGVDALASALVVAAQNLPAGPRPVVAWAHGTTGVSQNCAPSLLKDPFTAGAMPDLDQVIKHGWVLVATDYIGLGAEGPHAYLIGQEAGRAVLDAVRAAHLIPDLNLADETVVWGHSQGGGAALWTGILAPTYAPEANVIGVAALAPASDLPSLIANLDVVKGGSIFASYIIQGYSATYSDVRFDDYVRPTARILVREMASRCLAEPEVFASIITSLVIDQSIWAKHPASGPFGERLQENVPAATLAMPLLIGQGLGDELVLPAAQAAYAKSRCQAGGQVDYRTYEGFDHVGVVGVDSPLVPELLNWTQDRFDRKPFTSTC